MTVSSELNRKQYAGNGVTTSFATSPVVFFDSSDLDVYVVTTATGAATLLTETTDYTVSGGDGSTGTVATTGLYGAPSASQTLVIVRNVPLTQESDFVQNDASDAEVVEDALDKLTMALQQVDARVDRSFVLADSDVSGVSTTLPTPVASRLLGWNSGGTALENFAASDLSAVVTTAFTESLLDDGSAGVFVETLRGGLTEDTAPAVDDEIITRDTTNTTGKRMTLQNVLKVINGISADSAPDLAADYLLSYDASASAAKKVLLQQLPLPRGHLAGGALSNNSGDATNDIDIAAGEARDSTNVVNIRWSALTKQLDAAWAAGTAAGGRDTGAIADGWWYVFAIRKDSDASGDVLFSTSQSAPTMPSGYTYFRRIGAIHRASGALRAFTQIGDVFMFNTPVVNAVSTSIATASRTSITVTAPPITEYCTVDVMVTHSNSAGAANCYLSSASTDDGNADFSNGRDSLTTSGATAGAAGQFLLPANNSTVYARAGAANSTVSVLTRGFIDRRGKGE